MGIPVENRTELWGELEKLGVNKEQVDVIEKLGKELNKLKRERQCLLDNLKKAKDKVEELNLTVAEAAGSVNVNLELVENKQTLLMQAASRRAENTLQQLEGVSLKVKESMEFLSENDQLHVFQTHNNITQAHSQLQAGLDSYLYERAIFCNDKKNRVNVFEPLIGQYAWANNLVSMRKELAEALVTSYSQIVHNDKSMTWFYSVVFTRLNNYIQRITRKDDAPYSRRKQLLDDLQQLKMLLSPEQRHAEDTGLTFSSKVNEMAFLQTGNKNQRNHIVGLIKLLVDSRRLTVERQIELADKYIVDNKGYKPKGSRFWQELHSVDSFIVKKGQEQRRQCTFQDEFAWFLPSDAEILPGHLELQKKLQQLTPLNSQEELLFRAILSRLIESELIDTALAEKIMLVLFNQQISTEQYLQYFPEVFNKGRNMFKPRRKNVLRHQHGLKKMKGFNEKHDVKSCVKEVKTLTRKSIVSESRLGFSRMSIGHPSKMTPQQQQLDELRQTEMRLNGQYQALSVKDGVTPGDFYYRCQQEKTSCSGFLKTALKGELKAVSRAAKSLQKAKQCLDNKKKEVLLAQGQVDKAQQKLTEHDRKQTEATQKFDEVKQALIDAIDQYKQRSRGSFSLHGDWGRARAKNLLASVEAAKDLRELYKKVECARDEHIANHWLGKSCAHWVLFREGSLLTFVSAAMLHVLKNYGGTAGVQSTRLVGPPAPEHYKFALKKFNQKAHQSCGIFSTASYQRRQSCGRLLTVVASAA